MNEHTPGPWDANAERSRNGTINVGAQDTDGTLCQVAIVSGHPGCARWKETTFANARLIAAAPDLFAALDALVACHTRPDIESLWLHAAAALKKAKPN